MEVFCYYKEKEFPRFALPLTLYDSQGKRRVIIHKSWQQLELPFFEFERLKSTLPDIERKEDVYYVPWPRAFITQEEICQLINKINWKYKASLKVNFQKID